jgi:hypothetical protein
MKFFYLFCIGASSFLVAGCVAEPPHPNWGNMPPATATSPADKIWVISAVYGSGVKFTDVTSRVDALLHQPTVTFYARPEWLHADSTPGWNKALVIVYEFKGRRHIFTTGEGGEVSLEDLIHPPKRK